MHTHNKRKRGHKAEREQKDNSNLLPSVQMLRADPCLHGSVDLYQLLPPPRFLGLFPHLLTVILFPTPFLEAHHPSSAGDSWLLTATSSVTAGASDINNKCN